MTMPTTEKILTIEEATQKLIELTTAVQNMRQAQQYWHIHFGSKAAERKKRYEKKVDEILDSLGCTIHRNTNNIQSHNLPSQ
jgi:hypothetical protein